MGTAGTKVCRLWLDGHSVAEAVARRLRGGVLEREGTSVAVLQSDTRDHYRTFQMLERLLHAPPRLLQQLLFQIPPERQALLVQRYYAFDEALARELLGKKLSKGTKKELDEVSARTGVGIRSCRRQFDNFKRVFKAVEELRGPLAENIQQLFLLPPALARDYAAIVFFANSRFETGKRRLQFLSFGDFAACAQSMMAHWSQGALGTPKTPKKPQNPQSMMAHWSQGALGTPKTPKKPQNPQSMMAHWSQGALGTPKTPKKPQNPQSMMAHWSQGALGTPKTPKKPQNPQSMMAHWSQGALAPEAAEPDGDLPKSFLQDLKELKVLVSDKDLLDQHKSLVCSALRGKISVYNELEANFKALSRALVNVGGKLTHARDVRDFFVDLVEKVIEPCRSDKWSPGDLRLFLTHYTAAPRNLPGFRHQALWERYMAAISACLLRMYHD
ncbi:acidic fibroblast growth factor intracellular-binding protein isoform X2 [Molothrus aeneus]|uniref:acidic fibroblast growth factor intracellular-binding protein isoform X2 n=1 Tax=Molothrus aeneus TaxID=84833 RepID=UPI0034598AA9